MSTLAVKVGVALGIVAAAVSFFPILKLLMGECFFEQGCGKHENLQLIAVALASLSVGAIAAWGVARLVTTMSQREQ